MTKTPKPATIDEISLLLDKKLDDKLGLVESRLEQKLGQKLEEKLEQKLEEKLEQKLEEKLQPIRDDINGLKKQMTEGFDRIDDQFQNIIQVADDIATQKSDKIRSNLEPRVKNLENKVFAS